MKRFLLIPTLSLAALLAVGCSSGNTIQAEAPGGTGPQKARIESPGKYTLYHVTKFNEWAQPLDAKEVASFVLQANDKVGFDYVMPKDKKWDTDAKSDVVAYAGSNRINLGPIEKWQEKYYWANPDGWDSYWSGQPERVLITKGTLH